MDWEKVSSKDALEHFSSDMDNGLSNSQVNANLEKYGKNELQEQKKRSFLSKLKDQFSDFLVVILIIAAGISYAIGEKPDAVVILIIVLLNAFLSMYQEGKAEKGLESLKQMSSPTAKVIRNGKIESINSSDIVPGDVVLLEAGDIVPADIRLIDSSSLKIDESSLTGESVPVEKDTSVIADEDISIGDKHNICFMNTIVTYGRGKGVVVATGHETEIGKIATQIQTFDQEVTPLQKRLNLLGKTLGITTIIICIAVFVLGLLQGREMLDMFMVAISLAVAAIPEGLPAIVTIVLALGMNRMVERHAIVKKLLAVETLGSTTVICSDKTGTLTQNEMTVTKIYSGGVHLDVEGLGYTPKGRFFLDSNKEFNVDKNPDVKTLLDIAALCNDSSLVLEEDQYQIIGDPTEGALMTLAGKNNISKEEINAKYKRIEEIPFDSERKMMTTFHENYKDGKVISFTKGAPDIILDRCKFILINGRIENLTDEYKEEVLKYNSSFSRNALRVLAYAYKEHDLLPDTSNVEDIEDNLVFVGLTGMIDPARKEAKEAIKKCDTAGIKTIMITGDYKETAFAIAKDLGIAHSEDQVLMGKDLNKLSDDELKEAVKNTRVFARVSPEHKVKIVSALKANGHIVAMTGDGVNDAPALKHADIGISMGITGTDVAKNTAEMILTDDNFASIVSAVEEGRIIYDNIIKFVLFLLSCNIAEILIVTVSILLNLPVPLIAIQLLWLNLVTDSFPALALGVEKGDPDIMQRPPRDPNEPLITKKFIKSIIIQSVSIATAALLVYIYSLKTYDDLIMSRAMVFTTLIMSELLRAYSSRSQEYSVFELGVFTNRSLVYGTSFSFLLLLLVLYVPFLQPIFDTVPLNLKQWGIVLAASLIPLLVGELIKIRKHKRK